MADTTQQCTRCKVVQPLDQFYASKEKINKKSSWCRTCYRGYYHTEQGRAKTEEYRKSERGIANAKAQSRRVVFKRHNITEEMFNTLMHQQSGNCAICKELLRPGKETHIDHNHNTNAIRGLLCNKCNTGLGLFMDNSTLLRQAALYLDTKE